MKFAKSVRTYQRNNKQNRPCNAAYYRELRQHIRRLRSHSPTHYDVLWYANSLGLEDYSTDVAVLTPCGYHVGMTGPVGQLP